MKLEESLNTDYYLMKNEILPYLSSLYMSLNKAYSNHLYGLYIFRNSATGLCLNQNYKYLTNRLTLELALNFKGLIESEKVYNDIIDILERDLSKYRVTPYLISGDMKASISNAPLLRKIVDDGFCINNQQHERRFLENNYITIYDIFENFNDNMNLQHLVKNFPKYSWDIKQVCIKDEPNKHSHIEQKEYALYAALVHLWAKENYLNIPKWVHDPFYISSVPYEIGNFNRLNMVEEFKVHNIFADEREFINV